ncbi:MAG TPA: hypothetical protein PKD68_03425, partial [Candidatus Saccharibacteria bacterium]|nr:hypothetical protein [Candidatus Saccharibacteria bacterium]
MRKGLIKCSWNRARKWLQTAWAHVWVRRAVFGVILLLCFMVGVQFTYPSNRALPRAHVGTTAVGWKTPEELTPLLQEQFELTDISLVAGEQKSTVKLGDVGAVLEVTQTATQLAAYPWWQRLLPFSLFFVQPDLAGLPLSYTDSRLSVASEEIADKLKSDPQNGAVILDESGAPVVTAARQGVSVTSEAVKQAIQSARIRFGSNSVTVTADVTDPTITNDMIETAKARLSAVFQVQLDITNSLETTAHYTPDAKTIASWIHIGDKLALSINREKLLEFANTEAKSSLIAPGSSTV